MIDRLLVAATIVSAAVSAQSVTGTVTAVTTVQSRAGIGSTPDVGQVPAGPVASPGNVLGVQIAGGTNAFALNSWTTQDSAYESTFVLTQIANRSGANAYSDTGPHELLIEFDTAAQPIPVRYTIEYEATLGAGVSRSLGIDVGNDGVVEWSPTISTTFQGVGMIGPQPLAIRFATSLSNQATPNVPTMNAMTTVRVTVTADNGIDIAQVADGCTPGWNPVTFPGSYLARVPFFPLNGDVELSLLGASNSVLPVQVLGLSAGLTPLAPLAPLGLPAGCLGIPSPDLAVAQSELSVAVPQAVRPIAFWAQSFSVSTNPLTVGVASGRAFRVFAY